MIKCREKPENSTVTLAILESETITAEKTVRRYKKVILDLCLVLQFSNCPQCILFLVAYLQALLLLQHFPPLGSVGIIGSNDAFTSIIMELVVSLLSLLNRCFLSKKNTDKCNVLYH